MKCRENGANSHLKNYCSVRSCQNFSLGQKAGRLSWDYREEQRDNGAPDGRIYSRGTYFRIPLDRKVDLVALGASWENEPILCTAVDPLLRKPPFP